ncbi:MAG TPA: VTT domain-containing protein [Pseudorhodoplanes sp.]|nr:VTT domain-containing protein [Pseudorhodoplanes sp.]
MPTDLNQLLALIREHGELAYSLAFMWGMGNSLILLLLSGFAAQLGAFEFGKLVMVCWFGAFAGDAFRFWVGRRFGVKWLSSFPRIERVLQMTTRLVEHHLVWFAFLYRYPNGIRSLAAFAFGISSIQTRTFLLLNFLSAGVWAFSIVSVGYLFSKLADKLVTDAASHLSMALLIAFVALFWFLGKRLDRVIEKKI